MSPIEVREFEASPHHQEAIKLRLYDDDGKIAGLTIKPASGYRKILESMLTS